ncbi:glutaminase family protein [Novipirellula artificiosorum]|uniref:Glutaminase n=1 Tax=Novipirellula artificiosorum TaxID=2528016 RepID=A0A5C6DWM2_9BACT|nr:glutaminase family protein [Novipirellula artificiosorum]TWU41140.1 hypothetical protein Poly41_19780 [Novipirellula artificiosorum]
MRHLFPPKHLSFIATLSALVLAGLMLASPATGEEAFRPPAVPLVACDPYFSIWSQTDLLHGSTTTHWTGKPHSLTAMLRVDGKTYRMMGAEPDTATPMDQTSVTVLPTRTIYTFTSNEVQATLTFLTPALPADLMILSRPTTYVSCEVVSCDANKHAVAFYLDAGGELASNTRQQRVAGTKESFSNAEALKIGTVSQHVLGKSGDDLRIDWGYLYLATPRDADGVMALGNPQSLRQSFVESGSKSVGDSSARFPAEAGQVAAATAIEIGQVGSEPVSTYVLLAYDDLYSIEYMKAKLRPYWRKDGWEAADLIEAAIDQYDSLVSRCEQFDAEMMADLIEQGGKPYAEIAALAYRQCFAAGKFVADANGQPLQFCKENHSNGCIATSDVFYPMAPQFLLLGPTLTKSVLVPFMEYAASDRWKFPFAPHDLGTYPKANGQRYGGGETSEENQMPVEESGNMLVLFGALAKMEGHADFAGNYWEQLSQWADYLQQKGFDPENQLCTDDFAGHMAHNVNLSAKAICGLGAYAMLCEMRGLDDEAETYRSLAKQFAAKWVKTANDGDHYRLAFDQTGTWSQKYNLVWDQILDLGLFPRQVVETEMAFYRSIQNEYGLPLDNRSDYTKLDWVLWTATLTNDRDDFEAIVAPVHKFLNVTPDRSPMTDWYFTSTAKKRGFTARPVVGGVFLRMLYDESTWSKYASMDQTQASRWAPMPMPPKVKTLLGTSKGDEVIWSYTTEHPPGDWFATDFASESWKSGQGGFGTEGTPNASIGTRWDGSDIWVRRSFELGSAVPDRVGLRIFYDEDSEVYINGTQVALLSGYTTDYDFVEIPASSLRQGRNVIAIHCHQTRGGQFIDCGIDALVPVE